MPDRDIMTAPYLIGRINRASARGEYLPTRSPNSPNVRLSMLLYPVVTMIYKSPESPLLPALLNVLFQSNQWNKCSFLPGLSNIDSTPAIYPDHDKYVPLQHLINMIKVASITSLSIVHHQNNILFSRQHVHVYPRRMFAWLGFHNTVLNNSPWTFAWTMLSKLKWFARRRCHASA